MAAKTNRIYVSDRFERIQGTHANTAQPDSWEEKHVLVSVRRFQSN